MKRPFLRPVLEQPELTYLDSLYQGLHSGMLPGGTEANHADLLISLGSTDPAMQIGETMALTVAFVCDVRDTCMNYPEDIGSFDAKFIERAEHQAKTLRVGSKVCKWIRRHEIEQYAEESTLYSPEIVAAAGTDILRKKLELEKARKFREFVRLLQVPS